MFEIESSKLAAERAQGNVKAFADQMLADHQKTSDELKQMVTSGKVQATLPTSMTEEHQETLEELRGLQGDEFVEAYVSAWSAPRFAGHVG